MLKLLGADKIDELVEYAKIYFDSISTRMIRLRKTPQEN